MSALGMPLMQLILLSYISFSEIKSKDKNEHIYWALDLANYLVQLQIFTDLRTRGLNPQPRS